MSNATFSRDDVSLELPLAEATQGQDGYDIGKLLGSAGCTTLDVGFANTASCRSAITFIDGDAGILRYRGYPIEQLAEKSTFLEVSYLVLYGELPTATQLEAFASSIAKHHLIDERMREMFRSLPRKSHPMPVLSAGLNALSTYAASKYGEGAYDQGAWVHGSRDDGAETAGFDWSANAASLIHPFTVEFVINPGDIARRGWTWCASGSCSTATSRSRE